MTTHTVLLYQRPAQGTAFVGQHRATNYRHSIVALGGFDRANWSADLSRTAAEYAVEHYLGCVVRIVVDNPNEPIWEGYIHRMRYRVGKLVVTYSLENMANLVSVTYFNATSGAVVRTEQTATAAHAGSQAVYGVKEMAIQATPSYSSNVTHKRVVRDLLAVVNAYPQASIADAVPGDALLEFEAKGLQYYAWDWRTHSRTSNLADDASIAFQRMTVRTNVDATTNAMQVYETQPAAVDGRHNALIETNTSFSMHRGGFGSVTYLEYLRELAEAGDGTRRWVFGITMWDANTQTRRVYYRPATSAVAYTVRALGDSGRIRDVYGRLVRPWTVRPDAGIRINDILTGWAGGEDDPRVNYIEQITYDGTTGEVRWQSGDNVDVDGAYGLDKRFRPLKSREKNAPPLRLAV